MKTPNPNWQVTVQALHVLYDPISRRQVTVPGYVQVDDFTDGNKWSKGAAALAAEGYKVPMFDLLPQGRYTWARAVEMLQELKDSNDNTF